MAHNDNGERLRDILERTGMLEAELTAPIKTNGHTASGDTFRIELRPFDPTSKQDPNSNRSKTRKRCIASFLIGGQWFEFQVLIHRPMPSGEIVRAYISRRGKVELSLVIDHGSGEDVTYSNPNEAEVYSR